MSIPSHKINRTTRFGEKLRELRTSKGMTLREIATAVGQSAHGYISELEAGKKMPTVSLVLRIADLFHVTTDELLRDDMNIKESKNNETQP